MTPHTSLQEIVARRLARHEAGDGHRLGVAVSGGADSVFLLHVLRELGLAATVLHVNHGLRGADSEADEAFVRALAAAMAIPCHVATLPPAAGNVEQEARRARYIFFAERIGAGCCDTVATGHTLDDQAETVVSRFLRGTGTAGLSGIRPAASSIVRPLLDLRREDIRSWLRDRNITWREDRSNENTDFLRNRIRHDLMPQLAAVNPALPEVLAATATWAQGEEAYWDEEIARIAARILAPKQEALLLETRVLLELPVAVQRRLLRYAIERVRGSLRSIDFRHVEAILAMAATREGSGRLQLPDLDIYRSFDWLRLAPVGHDSRIERDFELRLEPPCRAFLPERQLTIEMELGTGEDVYNKQRNALDRSRCADALMLRNWRPGDSYCPAGALGGGTAQKIKTMFQEFRIPLWERRTWPVITSDGSIVWTRRFGVAAGFAAGPDSTRVVLIREAGESNGARAASNETRALSGVAHGIAHNR